MSDSPDPHTNSDQPIVYQIQIAGHLRPHWAEWFEGLTVTREPAGTTRLTGPVVDQAALYGLLKKVRDLGMPLIAVNRTEPGQAAADEFK